MNNDWIPIAEQLPPTLKAFEVKGQAGIHSVDGSPELIRLRAQAMGWTHWRLPIQKPSAKLASDLEVDRLQGRLAAAEHLNDELVELLKNIKACWNVPDPTEEERACWDAIEAAINDEAAT